MEIIINNALIIIDIFSRLLDLLKIKPYITWKQNKQCIDGKQLSGGLS